MGELGEEVEGELVAHIESRPVDEPTEAASDNSRAVARIEEPASHGESVTPPVPKDPSHC